MASNLGTLCERVWLRHSGGIQDKSKNIVLTEVVKQYFLNDSRRCRLIQMKEIQNKQLKSKVYEEREEICHESDRGTETKCEKEKEDM